MGTSIFTVVQHLLGRCGEYVNIRHLGCMVLYMKHCLTSRHRVPEIVRKVKKAFVAVSSILLFQENNFKALFKLMNQLKGRLAGTVKEAIPVLNKLFLTSAKKVGDTTYKSGKESIGQIGWLPENLS